MRIGRIVAALVIAPIVGGALYAVILAYQTATMHLRAGPVPSEVVGAGVMAGVFGLVFLALVLLPFAALIRKHSRFRAIVLVFGVVAWFGFSVLVFLLMGQAADVSASTGVQLLMVGVPMVAVFTALLGKGPHA